MSDMLFDLPAAGVVEHGKRTERIEWGQRAIRDHVLIGKKGTVRPAPGEEAAYGYDGAHYRGGPVMFEPVKRTVVTYTGDWEAASDDRH